MTAQRSERVEKWVEYRLATPCDWSELAKTSNAISCELGDRSKFDDVVQVVTEDDAIVFRFNPVGPE